MLDDYFEYQYKLAEHVVVPALEETSAELRNKRALDVGCGYGGILLRLHEHYGFARALGIDIDEQMIGVARKSSTPQLNFEVSALAEIRGQQFDLIIIRDVLEHIVDVKEALSQACALLAPGGTMYMSYGPFYSPFGGHQHNASGLFSKIPWIHLLPADVFRRIISVSGNAYKEQDSLREDIESVLATRLSISQFHQCIESEGLKFLLNKRYLIRPDYWIKFRLPALRLPGPAVPLITEFLCTGEQAIVQKA